MNKPKNGLPGNAAVFRVEFPYLSEGDDWRTSRSRVMTLSAAESEARYFNMAQHPPRGHEATVVLDEKAAEEFKRERAKK